jgi:hypothetical protein
MPLSQNKYHEKTWNYIIPRLWNKLPPELKNLNSVTSQLKTNLKTYIIHNATHRNSLHQSYIIIFKIASAKLRASERSDFCPLLLWRMVKSHHSPCSVSNIFVHSEELVKMLTINVRNNYMPFLQVLVCLYFR